MLRSAMGKVAWVGRTASMVFGLALVMALIFGAASVGLAANGQPFLLGKAKNTASKVSGLVGKVASGPALKVTNPSGGSALGLQVNAGQAPLTVNADAGKATNLDADKLDGKDATQLANAAHPHSGADINSGTVAEARIDPSLARDGEVMSTVQAQDGAGSALDADLLDGRDSSAFGIKTAHGASFTDECDEPNVWNECAKVQVTVPARKTYLVSVWSSFTARGGTSNQDLAFCSAMKGPNAASPSCITPTGFYSKVALEANQLRGATSSGEANQLSAGTYTFSTAIKPTVGVAFDNYGSVITKVLVRDASGATVSSATLKAAAPESGRER